jgi:predicted PurR-regulated permease PerM
MQLNLTTATRIGLNALGALGVAVALRLGESIFIPLTFAVLLAAILWPIAEWFNRRRVPWSIACMIAVSLLVVLFVVVTLGLTLAVPRIVAGLPNLQNSDVRNDEYAKFRQKMIRLSPTSVDAVLPEDPEESQLLKTVEAALKPENINRLLGLVGGYLGSYLLQTVLVIFIVLFLLVEGKMLTLRVVEIFGPSPGAQSRAVGVLSEIANSVRSYLVWRTIVNAGLAIVLGVVYQAAGLRQAWTWALLAAVLCYVPYIGTILAGVPPVLDAFLFREPQTALGILLFYVVVVTFEGYVIVPVVMGRSMSLNATTVLLACLFWDLVWGTPGLFLAMPLMAALKAVCMNVPGWRPWANLMGTEEGPAPPEPAPPDLDKTPLMDEAPLVKEFSAVPPPGEGSP